MGGIILRSRRNVSSVTFHFSTGRRYRSKRSKQRVFQLGNSKRAGTPGRPVEYIGKETMPQRRLASRGRIIMASTIKDIRRVTGLSLATISKYLNGGNVRLENKKKIDEAVRELDYHVNEMARSLVTKKSHSVGFIVRSLVSPFDSKLVTYAGQITRKKGYSLVICDSNDSLTQEMENVRFLAQKNLDGLLIIPVSDCPDFLEPLDNLNIPIVTLDRRLPGFDSVLTDHYRIGKEAAEYLLSKGHKRIAIIHPTNVITGYERFRGFVDTLKEHGIDTPQEYLKGKDATPDFGYQAMKELLKLPKPPTAVFTTNYDLNLGAIMMINEAGLKFPGDISLVGVDNLLLPNIMKPTLTCLVQPMEEIGTKAARMLVDHIQHPGRSAEPRTVTYPPILREGNSVTDEHQRI